MRIRNCRRRARNSNHRQLLSEPLEARMLLAGVTGTVWQDTNGNGERNQGDCGVAGVTVFMDSNRDGTLDGGERSVVTDANGQFTFPNTQSGNYNLQAIPKNGWSALPIDRLLDAAVRNL